MLEGVVQNQDVRAEAQRAARTPESVPVRHHGEIGEPPAMQHRLVLGVAAVEDARREAAPAQQLHQPPDHRRLAGPAHGEIADADDRMPQPAGGRRCAFSERASQARALAAALLAGGLVAKRGDLVGNGGAGLYVFILLLQFGYQRFAVLRGKAL